MDTKSQRAKYDFTTNQNVWILHDDGAIWSLHGMNRTVTTSHSCENDPIGIHVVYVT